MKRRYPTDLSDAERRYIEPYVSPPNKRGRPRQLGLSVEVVHRTPRSRYPRRLREDLGSTGVGQGRPRDRVAEKLLPPRGFEVLARRWVVERTFAWLGQNRRMSKDYERLCASGEAFIYAAMSRLMARRL